MHRHRPPIHQVELRVRELSELFNSMDPTPFHHCDLDPNAQDYIESWAMEMPRDSHFRVIVHIENMPADDPAPVVQEAIHNYFQYKSVLTRRNLRQLLREGRTSLIIGLVFLALCLFCADLLGENSGSTPLHILREGLLIVGWVAMWRPLQIFLYDWWPLLARQHIHRRLGTAIVHVWPAQHPAHGHGAIPAANPVSSPVSSPASPPTPPR